MARRDHKDDSDVCEDCAPWIKHREKYVRAREEYRKDADRQWDSDEICASVDMMKVFMLPKLPLKVCYSTQRLIAMNETFSVMKNTEEEIQHDKRRSCAIFWHEGIAGRDSEDVASAYWMFLIKNRELKKITFFADIVTPRIKVGCSFVPC